MDANAFSKDDHAASNREVVRNGTNAVTSTVNAKRALAALERGTSFYMKGRKQAAEQAFIEALKIDATNVAACAWLARCAADGARHEEALKYWRRAIQIDPADVQHRNGAAIALRRLGRAREAISEYLEAIGRAPAVASLHANLGTLFFDLDMHAEALQCFDTALILDAALAPAHANRGQALRRLARVDEAEAAFRVSLALDARQSDAWNGLGTIAFDRLSFDEAQVAFSRAVALSPDHSDAVSNLGSVLSRQGRFDEAVDKFERALKKHPNALNAQWGLALASLTLGDFKRGWALHETRLALPELASKFVLARDVFEHVPRWDGAALAGRSITLLPEQGFGDVVQFHRFAQRFVRDGAGVHIIAPKPLVRLLEAQGDGVRVVAEGDAVPRTDCAELAMSLPHRLGFDPTATPDPEPYLVAPPELLTTWKTRLDELAPRAPHGLRVALVWAGRPTHQNDALRSIAWDTFARVLDVEHVRFVSIQKGGAESVLKHESRVVDLAPHLNDFADTAAVLKHCDLLITVDSAPAHLAGALGVPVWNLLPLAPDWRWLLKRVDSPWYGSMTLHRQGQDAAWAPVIERVALALQARVGALQQ